MVHSELSSQDVLIHKYHINLLSQRNIFENSLNTGDIPLIIVVIMT